MPLVVVHYDTREMKLLIVSWIISEPTRHPAYGYCRADFVQSDLGISVSSEISRFNLTLLDNFEVQFCFVVLSSESISIKHNYMCTFSHSQTKLCFCLRSLKTSCMLNNDATKRRFCRELKIACCFS